MTDEFVFVVDRAFPDADVDPALAQIIQQRELHRQADRMMERHLKDGEPDANPGRAHRQRRREQQGIVVDAFSGEVMLRQPDIVEPQRLGGAHLLDLLVDADRVLVRRW